MFRQKKCWAAALFAVVIALVGCRPTVSNPPAEKSESVAENSAAHKAVAELTKKIRANPNDADAYVQRGTAYNEKGDVDKAITDFTQAIRLNPQSAEAHNGLGVALWGQRQREVAVAHWRKALELRPDYADAHGNLGFALKEQGKIEEAVMHFQEAVRDNPKLPRKVAIGNRISLKKNLKETEKQFLEAIRQRPDDVVAHKTLGGLYWQQAREAEQKRLEAEKKGNADAVAKYEAERNKNYDEATKQLREMLRIEPGNPVATNSFVLILVNQGKFAEATEFCRKTVEQDPKNLDVRHNLGVVLLKQGKIREGIHAWREVLKEKPDAMPTLTQLIWVLATCPDESLRNGAEAVKLAERAVEVTGRQDPVTLDTLAAAYAEIGEFDKAVKTAEEAAAAASRQNNKKLEDTIRARIKTYRAGSAFRDPSLAPGEKSKPQ